MKSKYIITMLALTYCSSLWSMSLLDAYHLAVVNDPVFQVAIQEHKADQQYSQLGLSALLPHITYSYNAGRSNSDVSSPINNANNDHVNRTYRSRVSNLTLQQPLFDYEAFSRYRKGVAQSLMADENFRSQSQSLFVRIVDAYVDALQADAKITSADSLIKTYTEQLALNKQKFSQGSGTRTDILETQAKLSLSVAQQVEAENNKNASLRVIRRLLGINVNISDLNILKKNFKISPAFYANYNELESRAIANNPKLEALRKSIEVSKYEVERNRAGFLPKLSFYASSNKSESASENTYNQIYDTNSYGIQINIPLYSGGETLASTRQSRHQMQAQIYKFDDELDQTISDLRKNYDMNKAALEKIKAYSLALDSAHVLTDATKKSITFGLRTNLDLLNSEQQLYNSKVELTKAKFEYIKSQVNIQYIMGALNEEELENIDNYFERTLNLQTLTSKQNKPSKNTLIK